jgi:hypothetical protein
MSDANANLGSPLTHSPLRLRFRILVAVAAGLLILSVGGLWWRFGEGVFLTSMMNAIIACF